MATGDNVEEEDWFTGVATSSSSAMDWHSARAAKDGAAQDRRRGAQDQVQQSSPMQQLKQSSKWTLPPDVSCSRSPCRSPAPVIISRGQANRRETPFRPSAMSTSSVGSAKQSPRRRTSTRLSSALSNSLTDELFPPEVEKKRRRASARIYARRSMWPSWRQVAVLSFLFILITSLLTTLNVLPSAPSPCLLFNHCHALSVSTQASAGSRLSGSTLSSSSTTSTVSPLDSTTSSTTTTASTSINAPTAPSVSTQASSFSTQASPYSTPAAERQPGDRSAVAAASASTKPHMHHLWSNQLSQSPGNSKLQDQRAKQLNSLDKATDPSVKTAGSPSLSGEDRSKQRHNHYQHYRQQPQQDNNGPMQRPPQVNNNYQLASDNNGQSFSQQQRDSSITSATEDAASDMSAGRRLTPFDATNSATQVPIHSGSSSAIKLVAGPSLAETPLKHSPTRIDSARDLGEGWSLTADAQLNQTLGQQHLRQTHAAPDLQNADSRPASVTPRQQLPSSSFDNLRDQFLVSAGLAVPQSLLHSVMRDALGDFVNYEPPARPLILQSEDLLPVSLAAIAAHNRRNLQAVGGSEQQANAMAASQSAPSISLPPLSHFLVPRNPFRLFSSSSTPIGSRYRPFQKSSKQQSEVKPAASSSRWSGVRFMGASSNNNNNNNNNNHNNNNLKSFRMPANPFQGSSSYDESPASLYAHSHSAEQLERLVRAASQATGVHTPILPAIVSAPSGAFPGFYIPAIESDSEESQVSELRHGEPATISSKIPGTDYILHPDEVRTMINIGELAWRQRQLANPVAASAETSFNQMAADSSRTDEVGQDWQSFGQRQQRPAQLAGTGMRENHAENVRDFAYVDQQQRQQMGPQQQQNVNLNSSDLETHLANHFKQQRVNAFPAIIRVNDQDYVHWPLIKPNKQKQHQEQQQSASGQVDQTFRAPDEPRKMLNLHQFSGNGPALYQSAYPREHLFAIAAAHPSQISQAYTPLYTPQAFAHQRPGWIVNQPMRPIMSAASMTHATNLRSSGSKNVASDFDNSPVRLATQLTPHEVRQVEDSIIEALIMSQSMQHQRKLMQGLAASQSRNNAHFRKQGNNNGNNNQKASGSSRLRNALFGRRRRRQSSTAKSAQPAQQMASSESVSPLLNVSGQPPVHIISSLLPSFTDLHSPQVVTPSMLIDSQESMMFESKMAPMRRLPVVMADQETNRPRLVSDSALDSQAESSAPAVAVVKPPPAVETPIASLKPSTDQVTLSSEPHQAVMYGSRVSRNKMSPNTGGGQTFHVQKAADYASPAHKVARQHVSDSLGDPVAHKPNHHDVDWPTMVSDADYFPSSIEHQKAAKATQPSPPGVSQQLSQESRQSLDSRERPVTRGPARPVQSVKNFVQSQLKLQFAQDYQAREGVPIYNNNVRVAGGLDRQRLSGTRHRQVASNPATHKSASENETNNEDDSEDVDDSDEDRTGDPQQRAASTTTTKQIKLARPKSPRVEW